MFVSACCRGKSSRVLAKSVLVSASAADAAISFRMVHKVCKAPFRKIGWLVYILFFKKKCSLAVLYTCGFLR